MRKLGINIFSNSEVCEVRFRVVRDGVGEGEDIQVKS